jgi:hypothetical protein
MRGLADLAGFDHLDGAKIPPFKVQPVGNHQLNARPFGGCDHSLTIGLIKRHGLLTEDVNPRFRSPSV